MRDYVNKSRVNIESYTVKKMNEFSFLSRSVYVCIYMFRKWM